MALHLTHFVITCYSHMLTAASLHAHLKSQEHHYKLTSPSRFTHAILTVLKDRHDGHVLQTLLRS
jgi:hypothetical protein